MPGHFLARVSHAPQSCGNCIFGHRAVWAAEAWKNIRTAPRHWLKPTQYFNDLGRQRNYVLLLHLHANSRNPPLSIGQVEFAPLRFTKLAGADEYQGRKLQRSFGRRLTSIFVNGLQQLGKLRRLNDGCVVLRHDRRKRTAQIRRGIARRATSCNCVAEDLTTTLFDPICGLMFAAFLKPTQKSQHVGSGWLSAIFSAFVPRLDLYLPPTSGGLLPAFLARASD